jgi:hypothetical protein
MIPRVSNSAGKYRAAEAAVLLAWIGVSILILVTVPHPIMALAFCFGAMCLLRGVIRQIRQVRDITEKYRQQPTAATPKPSSRDDERPAPP